MKMRSIISVSIGTAVILGFTLSMQMDLTEKSVSAQAAPTPVSPGQQVVRSNVTIRYQLIGR